MGLSQTSVITMAVRFLFIAVSWITILKHVVRTEISGSCEPCVCDPVKRTMECLGLSYIPPPPPGVDKVRVQEAIFGTFDQYNLVNLTSRNITELTLDSCQLSILNPKTLFTSLTNLEELRLNKIAIIPEYLRLAFYSLRFTKITTLYLDDMDPAPLPCRFFDGLSTTDVSVLSFRRNSIRTLSATSGSDIFEGTPKLKTLILSENQISDLSSGIFIRLQLLEELYLDQNKIITLGSFAFNISSLIKLNMAQNRFDFTSVHSTGDVFGHMIRLEVLNISGNHLKYLAREKLIVLFQSLHQLKVLAMENTGLSNLPQDIFANMKNLRSIYLRGNQLKKWDPDVFQTLRNLELVRMDKNKIQTVGANQLYSVVNKSHPVYLNLANNPFSCTCDLRVFIHWLMSTVPKPEGYPKLYACLSPFNVSNTPLKDITFGKKDCIDNMIDSTTLPDKSTPCSPCVCQMSSHSMKCAEKDLPYIPVPNHFVKNVQIIGSSFNIVNGTKLRNLSRGVVNDLTIANCDIHALHGDTFAKLTFLETLNLSGSYIPVNDLKVAFHGLRFTGIQKLILDNMNLGTLPPNFFEGLRETDLNIMSLANNILSTISSDGQVKMFTGLAKLQTLFLNDNKLTRIENNSFQDLSSLKYLHLENNRISALDMYAFNIPSLTNLYMANNNYAFLDSIAEELFRHVPKLLHLDISNNSLHALNPESMANLLQDLTDLNILEMRNSGLRVLPLPLLSNKRNLRVLNLAQNKIIGLNPRIFEVCPYLDVLFLKGNRIQSVTKEQLNPITQHKLTRLNLANNPFTCSCDLWWFKRWINTTWVHLLDFPEQYRCATPSQEAGKLLANFQPHDRCLQSAGLSRMVIAGIVLSVVVVFLSAVAIVVYYKRRSIWHQTSRLKARWRSQRVDSLRT